MVFKLARIFIRMVSRKIEELLEKCDRKYLVIVSGKSPLPNIYATLGRASGDIRKHYCTDDLGEVFERELNSKLYIYALTRENNHYKVLMYYADTGKIRKLGEDIIERKREPRESRTRATVKIIFRENVELCKMMEIITQIYPELVKNYVIEDNIIHIRIEGEQVDSILSRIESIVEKYRDIIEKVEIRKREKIILRPGEEEKKIETTDP